MGLKVLIAEKSKSETFEQYDKIEVDESYKEDRYKILIDLTDIVSEVLRREGYETRVLYGIDRLTSRDFSSVDCVIVHPLIRQAQKIYDLRRSNPQIGLIISAADDSRRHFQNAIRDVDGVYILAKPFKVEQLLQTIENSVKEARGI